MDSTDKTPPSSQPPAQPVAGNGTSTPVAPVATTPDARQTATEFGGLRDGKRRKDGLTPGSPEAKAADRAKDAERKRLSRASQRGAEPPPLPSARATVENTPQTQAGDSGPMPGIASVPGGPVPWDSQTLKPLFDQLIPTVEKLCVTKISNMATQARLPGELVRDIERDATWSEPAKKALTLSGPQLAAKYLNKTGISAENQPEVIFFTAAITIASGHAMIMKRLEKLIVIANANAQKPETKP